MKTVARMVLVCAILTGLTGICSAQESHRCVLAIVEWKDAVVYTRQPLANPDEMTPSVVSIGCVVVAEKTVLVIQSITEGKPDIFMIIPKDWVQTITTLQKVPDEKAPEKPTEKAEK